MSVITHGTIASPSLGIIIKKIMLFFNAGDLHIGLYVSYLYNLRLMPLSSIMSVFSFIVGLVSGAFLNDFRN